MKLLVFLAFMLLGAVAALGETEIDRDSIRQEIMQRYPFSEPQPGDAVSIQMLNGALINGTLEAITPELITLKTASGISVSHYTQNIHPFSKAFLFREDYENALEFEVEKEVQIRLSAITAAEDESQIMGRFFGVTLGRKVPKEFIISQGNGDCLFLPTADFRFPDRSDAQWVYFAQIDSAGRVEKIYALLQGNVIRDAPEYFEIFKLYCERYDLQSNSFGGRTGFRPGTHSAGNNSPGAFSGGGLYRDNTPARPGHRTSPGSFSRRSGNGFSGFRDEQDLGDWVEAQNEQNARQQEIQERAHNVSSGVNSYLYGITSLEELKGVGFVEGQSDSVNIKFLYTEEEIIKSLPSVDTKIIEVADADGNRLIKASSTVNRGRTVSRPAYLIIITSLDMLEQQVENLKGSLQQL